jgi:leader peptidase (prepilin peptidase)/N-methyltransferase
VTGFPLDLPPILATPLFEGAAFALGLVIGSFANVCIHRLPRHESIVTPRSRCPRCAALISPLDNVPVLAYLLLRGRCRRCRAPISVRYPAIELANGLLYLGLALVYGPTPLTPVRMALATALLVLALIDLEHHLLPNVITLPGIAAGLAASFLPGSAVTPWGALAAAAGGYVGMAAVARAAEAYYGQEALGQGDWKMVAMLGAFFGWRGMLLAVLVGTAAGAVVGLALVAAGRGSGRTKLPLGTFLAAGALVALFAADPLLSWYATLYGG